MTYQKNDPATVIFYAPVGNLIKGFKNGGAEAGCRKTMEVLQKGGHQVLLIEKPAKKSSSKWDGIVLLVSLIKVWLEMIQILRKNKDGVLHIAGFYLNQIYFEWLLINTAKWLGVKTVYEIRNGGMIEAYQHGGSLYQYFMRSTLVKSTLVLCQGYDYVVFLRQSFGKDSVYYPNYIMDDFVTGNESDRDSQESVKLIYFGRVVPDKNVGFIIDVCKELRDLKITFSLDIIGAYEDAYHQLLMNKIDQHGLATNIKFHGRMDFKEIYKQLKASHFFIFPSKEKREGHSNSLTEAMGCGVVPIASNAGFNENIVGNATLVIPDFDARLYAGKIAEIWTQRQWPRLSGEAYKRIVDNYTESIVKNALLEAYKKITYP